MKKRTLHILFTVFLILGLSLISFQVSAEQNIGATQTGFSELAQFLSNPFVSTLLLIIGFTGLLIEIATPGFGGFGGLGLAALVAFFWSKISVGMIDTYVIILVGLGMALLLVELLAIPGFGVTGILGIIGISAGIIMSFETIWQGVLVLCVVFLATVVIVYLVVKNIFAKSPEKLGKLSKLILNFSETPDKGYISKVSREDLADKTGVVVTPLRPIGTVMIEEEKVDAFSEGVFIDVGTKVKVIKVEEDKITVRPI